MVEQTDSGFQDPLEIFNIHWCVCSANFALKGFSKLVFNEVLEAE